MKSITVLTMVVHFRADIGQAVQEKNIYKFGQCSFVFLQLSTLGKGHGPTFEQI